MILYGRFLSNTPDPATDKYGPTLSYHAWSDRTGVMAERERQAHRDWIARNVIGPPQATATKTVEQMQAEGYVGVYAPVVEETPK